MKLFTILSLLILTLVSGHSIAQTSLDKKVKIKESKTKIWFDKNEKTIEANKEIRYEIYHIEGNIVKKGVGTSISCSNLMPGDYYIWIKTAGQISLDPDRKFDINDLPPNTFKFHID